MSNESHFRKAKPPAFGPSFDNSWIGDYAGFAGSPALMFDTSKLTLADYSEMRTHPQVNASLSLMQFMLHQVDWYVECEDKKIAELVEENMRLIWTQLVRGVSTAYWAGASPMVLEWTNTNDDKIFIDKVKDIHPTQAKINWKKVDSSYIPRPSDVTGSARSQIKPQVNIYDGIKKAGLGYPIPPEHTLYYPVLREHGDWSGRKLLAPAFQPWYFSLLVHLFANRYFERFGEPVPIGRAPFQEEYQFDDVNGNTVEMTGKQVIEDAITRLRSSGSVTLPSDRDPTASVRSEYMYDIEYLESQMRGADFERYLSRLDEEISLAIFTPMLLMRSGDKGSLNLGVQHTQTWMKSLNALAADLKEYIDPYICERIKAYNFTPNAPRCEWKIRPMGKDSAETTRAIVTTLIREGHAKVDLEDVGASLGMRLEEIRGLRPDSPSGVDARGEQGRDDVRTVDGPATVDGTQPTGGVQ